MVDKEKVLAGLESCADRTGALCRTCPYDFVHNENCMGDMAQDALELLKEQGAVEPEVQIQNEIDRIYRCPKCHKAFFYMNQRYCDYCGQAVKWDG